jgi:hypothetical protein
MAINSIGASVDRTNYAKYSADFHTIQASAITNVAAGGELLTFALQRRCLGGSNGSPSWLTLASRTFTASSSQALFAASFDLTSLYDSDGFYLGRHSIQPNDWRVLVTSGAVSAEADFSVLIMAIEDMKSRWCFGLPLISIEKLQIVQQPQRVTGVTVTGVSFGSSPGYGVLSYNQTNNTLQWRTGPVIQLNANQTIYVLADANNKAITVSVVATSLPVSSVTEQLFVDYGVMPDSTIIKQIIAATVKIEGFLFTAIEPKLTITRQTAQLDQARMLAVLQAANSLNSGQFDEVVDAITYYRPTNFNQWLHIESPYLNSLTVRLLSGFMNQTKVTDIDKAWIYPHGQNGKIDLVPSNAAILNWFIYGAGLYTIFFHFAQVPGFWNFIVLHGLRDCPDDIADYIGQFAAIPLLTEASQARYPAGVAGYAIARDGVSESRTLLPAVYRQYAEQIAEQIGRDPRTGKDALMYALRERYVGFISVVL